jgi:hypothetical protein
MEERRFEPAGKAIPFNNDPEKPEAKPPAAPPQIACVVSNPSFTAPKNPAHELTGC